MPEHERPRPGAAHCIVGFDFGLKRIGIAAGDTLTARAAPRPAAAVHERGPDWDAIEREVRALAPSRLVVGVPYNADGSPAALAAAARRFAAALRERFGLPVDTVDERFSSIEASAALKRGRAAGTRRRVRSGELDSAAAAVILERWLAGEREPAARAGPGPKEGENR